MRHSNFFSLEQVIDRQPLTVTPETPIIEVIRQMQEWANSCSLTESDDDSDTDSTGRMNNSCALVVEDAQLQGIFTERDLVRLIATEQNLAEIAVGEVMCRELITLTATGSEDIFTALNILRQQQIRHLPIIDESDRLLGLITEKNLRQNLKPIDLMKWRRVEEVMSDRVIHAPPTISLRYAAQLMAKHRVSYVAIVEPDREQSELLIPVGIITERDIVQFQTLNLDLAQPVQKLMSTPLFLVHPQDSLWTVYQQMQQRRVRRLLVAGSQRELQGIITQTSLLQVFDPTEMYGVIKVLQRQVCQLELERTEYLQNRTSELEIQVTERISEITKVNQQLQQQIEERKQVQAKLKQQLELEQQIFSISARFLNVAAEQISTEIESALQIISESNQFETGYIFRFCEDQATFSMTHEWVTPEAAPQIQNAQNLPVAMFPWAIAKIKRGETFYVNSVANLPPEASVDRENWQIFNLCSLVIIPIKQLNTITGWIGFASFFDEQIGSPLKINLFQIVGEIIASTLQRQQSDLDLQASEQRFNSILGSLEDVVWSIDPNTLERIYINSAVEQVYDRQVFEFYDNPHLWLEVVHPEDLECVSNFAQNIIETEGGEIEYRIVRPDREIRWLYERAHLIRDASGAPIRLDGIVTDISDRQRREKILKDIASGMSVEIGANFLPSLVEYLSKTLQVDYAFVGELIRPEEDSIRTLAVYGQNQVIDNFEYHLAGTPCQNIVGKKQCIYPEAIQQLFPDDQMLKDLAAKSYAGMPIFDLAGQALGLISIIDSKSFDDISLIEEVLKIFATRATIELERQKAEDKIRHQAALLDVTNDAIIVRGLDNQILFWNRGAEQLYGWKKAEALEQDANKLLYRESSTEFNKIQSSVKEKGEWQGELNQVTKAGKDLVVESRWSLVKDEAENPQSYLVVNTDITEQKQLEAQFLRTQRLESLGTLAGGISHDLNNILTPILGFAKLLPLKLPNVDGQTKEYFKIIETNAQRGSALVKQILTFARGLEGDRGTVQIRHLIAEIKQIIEETFPKVIELEISAPQNLWTVNGDVNQLHQVLMNLAVNARDAMLDGGKLTIKAENFIVDNCYARLHLDVQQGSYVLITVADTGVGISAKIIERIFEPFFTTKEIGHGTGLGLSTVIGIVKSHGGFIDVVSDTKPDSRGTQFKVFLPASETAAITIEETEELPHGNGELILVVDDETSILEVTKATLETYNYRVLTANDGIDAIAVYAQNINAITLVLMDIMMPSLGGKTAIRTLQKINPKVKIIAASGLVSNHELVAELENSIEAFVAKPYTNDELLRIVYEVIKD